MKRRIRQLSSFCMAVLLLLSCFVIGAPQARADEKISIENADISIVGSCNYNGSEIKPGVMVQIGGEYLARSCYSTEYKNNVEVGQASVTVTGKGNYTGEKTLTLKFILDR